MLHSPSGLRCVGSETGLVTWASYKTGGGHEAQAEGVQKGTWSRPLGRNGWKTALMKGTLVYRHRWEMEHLRGNRSCSTPALCVLHHVPWFWNVPYSIYNMSVTAYIHVRTIHTLHWILFKITGFSDPVHRPAVQEPENTTIRKPDLFPSSGVDGRHLLCWPPLGRGNLKGVAQW